MKLNIMVGLIALIVLVVGVSVLPGGDDKKQVKPINDLQVDHKVEESEKIIQQSIGEHCWAVFDNLPEDTKKYMKHHPEMVEDLVGCADPTYMGLVDAARSYLHKVDKKDVTYLYENQDVMFTINTPDNDGEPPYMESSANTELIARLRSN